MMIHTPCNMISRSRPLRVPPSCCCYNNLLLLRQSSLTRLLLRTDEQIAIRTTRRYYHHQQQQQQAQSNTKPSFSLSTITGVILTGGILGGSLVYAVTRPLPPPFYASPLDHHHDSSTNTLTHHHSTTTPPHYERLSLDQVLARFTTNTRALERNANTPPSAMQLGQGSFGHVLECVEPHTGREVAVKVVSKALTRKADFEREVDAMRSVRMNHHMVRILDVVDCEQAGIWLLVMEMLKGGELFDRVLKTGPFDEKTTKTVVSQVVEAVAFLHEAGWVHNDIKPENILFVRAGSNEVKLVDFGSARRMGEAAGVAGTAAYWPPPLPRANEEALVDPRTRDMWSLGILLYVLLFACHPFDREGSATDEDIIRRAKLGSRPEGYMKFKFEKYGLQISHEARDMITRLLEPNPSLRMTMPELLDHEFWKTTTTTTTTTPAVTLDGVKSSLRASDRERRKDLREALLLLAKQNEKSCYLATSGGGDGGNINEETAFVQEIAKLSSRYARKSVTRGELFFPGGSPTDGMYMLCRGGVSVEYGDASKIAQTLGPGDLFGETAVLDGRSTRNASVRCFSDTCEAIFFPRDDVVSILTLDPDLRRRLEEVSNRRYRVRAGRILERMLPGLEDRKRHYEKGSLIWSKGDDATAIYLIKSGKVQSILPVADTRHGTAKDSWFLRVFFKRLEDNDDDEDDSSHMDVEGVISPSSSTTNSNKVKSDDGTNAGASTAQDVVVARWYPGDLIGISTLVGSTRMATARVVSDEGAELIEIGKDELRKCLESEPSLRENLARHFRRFKERALSVER